MLGSLIIDKPDGLTSHDVVARVRRAAATRRVGHAGTLDPFATGVLVVCVGRATRLVQFLSGLDKEYLATVRLGFATDTQDLSGKQATSPVSSSHLSVEDVRRAMIRFTGPQLQLPPMFSAKKIGGERLYRAAREGREVERAPVPIIVHSLELVESSALTHAEDKEGTRDFIMRVRCSSGTYVRTLAHDIGKELGVGAHLAALRRTRVGHFKIESALTLEEVEAKAREGVLEGSLVRPSQMLAHLPEVILDDERMRRVLYGMELRLSPGEQKMIRASFEPLRLCDEAGALVAVGEYDGTRQTVKPRVVIHEKV
ncbi:MAG TPA: tRNA pseudouridine(55) synthase TruB, partial [Blastocatellia bacterium]|jgi:tRNA pseudouridine55 synthase